MEIDLTHFAVGAQKKIVLIPAGCTQSGCKNLGKNPKTVLSSNDNGFLSLYFLLVSLFEFHFFTSFLMILNEMFIKER